MTDNSFPRSPLEKNDKNEPNNEILRSFLEQGGDINAVDSNGYSLLMLSAELGNINLVSLLITNGADLNINLNFG